MKTFEITDDSGFLGILNPHTYISFVDENWQLEQLINHFKHQINNKNLLLWGTGSEGTWRVEVNNKMTERTGFRDIEGIIEVTDNKLCLINYESLTMGAQFSDVILPEDHLKDCIFEISNGLYICRIIQMFEPEESYDDKSEVHFIIEYDLFNGSYHKWNRIPWFESNFN
ncbi:hypothetical protein [Paenibacillus sp. N3.4]|uniref:hypothetical protein n=1 Tax=Paenibacillus sp. N3.4 TaxID=2603222 RepID=UPI0011C9A3FE|nr:hypothetical protein [Paenibacillus sp. N3.4]TXK84670.1 hypothetical protein FU659_07525 [Paenibacillus sp. N3.4]